MKHLTKSRFIIACFLALVASWAFHGWAITPLKRQEAEARQNIADLRGRIDNAQKTIAEVQRQEQGGGVARNGLERDSELPTGPVMVWLPSLVKAHFKRFGIGEPVVRLKAIRNEADIPGYDRGYWSVRLPIDEAGRNLSTVTVAVADLEQQKPFLRVVDFSIRPDSDNSTRRIAAINIAVLCPKTEDPSSDPPQFRQ